jgi:UDP-hydrolysing UDP-N-acetyl-D-glucosamine 2-epimerase
MVPLRIAVVTGTRADYGLLRTLVAALSEDPAFEVGLLVTGSHLSERFGMTVGEIEADGWPITARVPLPLDDDSPVGVARATGVALSGLAEALDASRPDLVVVLGDRTEALAAASAAVIVRVPIVHLHGGELTEGAIDDAIRHAITKLAWLHFTSTEVYRRRVIQMGEDPALVHAVGALGVDNAWRLPRLSKERLEADLGPVFGARTAVVTFHPETLSDTGSLPDFEELLTALDRVPELSIVFTRPNADAGNRALSSAVDGFVAAHPDRASVFVSLGAVRYASLLALADVCVGNSSSGIIEAPALGTPTVDVGDRQRGRVAGPTVLHVPPVAMSIQAAIETALSAGMQELSERRETPYGDGHATERMVEVLRGARELLTDAPKRFHDLTDAPGAASLTSVNPDDVRSGR